MVSRGVVVAAGAETELDEERESLSVVVDVAGALTADKKDRTEVVAAVLLEVSEELDGGDPGGVVLKGISRLCRVFFSALTAGGGFGSTISSASLV